VFIVVFVTVVNVVAGYVAVVDVIFEVFNVVVVKGFTIVFFVFLNGFIVVFVAVVVVVAGFVIPG
jgi:hypothetical protein